MKKLGVFVMLVCLLGFGLATVSCDSGSGGGSSGNPVGTWRATETITEGGFTITVNITLRIESNNTWTLQMAAPAFGIPNEEIDRGTWSQTGNTVNLRSTLYGDSTNATIDGNRLTVRDPDMGNIVFTRS